MMKLFCALLLLVPSFGAECSLVEGDRILGRDLKRAQTGFEDVADDALIGFAPLPGVRRILTHRDLARFGSKSGTGVCFERTGVVLTKSQLEKVLRAALDRPNASLEILDYTRSIVPVGELEFPLRGLSRPLKPDDPTLWRGHVRFDSSSTISVWARVRVTEEATWVEPAVNLSPAQTVEADQLRIHKGKLFPFGLPAAATVEEFAGLRPRRTIRIGQTLALSMFEEPPLVSRNETVAVEVRSGAVSLRFEGRAESNGRAGDDIVVLDAAKGRRFKARVTGKGKVIVDANHDRPVGAMSARVRE